MERELRLKITGDNSQGVAASRAMEQSIQAITSAADKMTQASVHGAQRASDAFVQAARLETDAASKMADASVRSAQMAADAFVRAAKLETDAAVQAANAAAKAAEESAIRRQQAAQRAIEREQADRARAAQTAVITMQGFEAELDKINMSGVDYRITQVKREAAANLEAINKMTIDRETANALITKNAEVMDAKLMALQAEQTNAAPIKAWAGEFVGAMVGPMAQILAATAAFTALKDTIGGGFGQNIQRENLTIGLGSVINGMSTFQQGGKTLGGNDAFIASEDKAREALNRFNIEATKTQFTGSQLAESAMTLASVYMGLGRNTDDLVGFTGKLATAASATALPLQQVARETDEILQGRITTMNVFFQRFKGFLTEGEIATIRQGGQAAAAVLETALGRLSAAADAHKSSWEGVTSTLHTVWDQFTRMASEPAFSAIESGLNGISNAMFEGKGAATQLRPEILALAEAFGVLPKILADTFSLIGPTISGLSQVGSLITKGRFTGPTEPSTAIPAGAKPNLGFLLHGDMPGVAGGSFGIPSASGSATSGATEVTRQTQQGLKAVQLKLRDLENQVKIAITHKDVTGANKAITTLQGYLHSNGGALGETLTSGEDVKIAKYQASVNHLITAGYRKIEMAAGRIEREAVKYAGDSGTTLSNTSLDESGFHVGKFKSLDSALHGAFNPGKLGDLGVGLINPSKYIDAPDKEIAYRDSADELKKRILDYQKWTKDEAKKWDSLISQGIGAAAGMIENSISGKGNADSAVTKALGGIAAGIVGAANPIAGAMVSAGVGILAAAQEYNAKVQTAVTDAASGKTVNRADLVAGLTQKYTSTSHIKVYVPGAGPSGQGGRWDDGTTSTVDRQSLNSDLINYDNRHVDRFNHSMETGAAGDRDRAKDALSDWHNEQLIKGTMPAAELERETAARNTLIDVTYELAKAADAAAKSMESVNIASGGFNGSMDVAKLRDSFGLSHYNASDVNSALMSGGVNQLGGNISSAAGILGNADKENKLLTIYGELLNQNRQGAAFANDPNTGVTANSRQGIKDAGLQVEGLDQMNGADLAKLFSDMLIPAMREMRSIMGSPATKNIGSMDSSSPQAITLQAPTSNISTYNQQVVVNTYAITGDKASIRELAKILAVEMNTMTSQAS